MRDGEGNINSVTEVDAQNWLAQGHSDAVLANSLFIAAGATAVIAVVLWLLGAR
jgi:hypothetical protein